MLQVVIFDRIHNLRVKDIQDEYQKYMERVRSKAQGAIDQANATYQGSRGLLTARVEQLALSVHGLHRQVRGSLKRLLGLVGSWTCRIVHPPSARSWALQNACPGRLLGTKCWPACSMHAEQPACTVPAPGFSLGPWWAHVHHLQCPYGLLCSVQLEEFAQQPQQHAQQNLVAMASGPQASDPNVTAAAQAAAAAAAAAAASSQHLGDLAAFVASRLTQEQQRQLLGDGRHNAAAALAAAAAASGEGGGAAGSSGQQLQLPGGMTLQPPSLPVQRQSSSQAMDADGASQQMAAPKPPLPPQKVSHFGMLCAHALPAASGAPAHGNRMVSGWEMTTCLQQSFWRAALLQAACWPLPPICSWSRGLISSSQLPCAAGCPELLWAGALAVRHAAGATHAAC